MFDMLNGHLPLIFFGQNFTYIILGHIWRDLDTQNQPLGQLKKLQCHTTWKPTENPTIEHPGKKKADFGGSIGMDVVNFIEPNLQEIIFTPIRVGLITQK